MAHKGATRGRNERQNMSSPHLFLALLSFYQNVTRLEFRIYIITLMSSKMLTNSSGAERSIQNIGEDRGRLDLTAGKVLFQYVCSD